MDAIGDALRRRGVSVWGIGHLGQAVDGGRHHYVAFCLPYRADAVARLPDDAVMNECLAELARISQELYAAIADATPGCEWVRYDAFDQEHGLRRQGVSQKVLAHLAGLGWLGRSSLLVTDAHGPRVRIGTAFTEMPIGPVGTPHQGSCGTCRRCQAACPSQAIGETGLDVDRCREVVADASGRRKLFCGLCMKVCPVGADAQPDVGSLRSPGH